MLNKKISQIQSTLDQIKSLHVSDPNSLGHFSAIKKRKEGRSFSLQDHVEGFILAQLSNQRPWKRIDENLDKLSTAFHDYDPGKLMEANLDNIEKNVREMKCGNRQIHAQISSLPHNISIFYRIQEDFGSLDNYVVSDKPNKIAKELGTGKRYKMKQIGFALATEYLRNVGIDAPKPDTHICRIIGPERLGWATAELKPEKAFGLIMDIASELGISAAYIDSLLWQFAAKDYTNICGDQPKCEICKVENCNKKLS